MYGSYGSYSSMGAISITAPMDITSNNMLAHDRSCAFPSWPRRDSLTSSESDRPTSYLSDEDLFLPDTFEDDSHSISGTSSNASPPQMAADEFLELEQLERQREAMQREAALRYIMNEKERRRQQAARRQRAMGQSRSSSSSSSKKGSKSKLASMTSANEAVFED